MKAPRWRAMIAAMAMLPLMLALDGCGGGSSSSAPPSEVVSGIVSGGEAPISGSKVILFEAGRRPDERASRLGEAVSDADGSFKIKGAKPHHDAVLYLVGESGDAGGGINPAIRLMAILGTPAALPASVVVNELTTVAAAYAFSNFFTDEKTDLRDTVTPSISIATAVAGAIVDVTTGDLTSNFGDPTNNPARFNTIANALANCVQLVTPDACTNLFLNANQPDVPSDTLLAARNMNRAPANNVSEIFDTAAEGPFAPVLDKAPTDWTISIFCVSPDIVRDSTTFAIDSSGNLWLTTFDAKFTGIDPAGNLLSPPDGFSGGGLIAGFHSIAIDGSDNIWITNTGSNTVSKFCGAKPGNCPAGLHTGDPISSSSGYTGGGLDNNPGPITFDHQGNAWISDCGFACGGNQSGPGSVTALSPLGVALSPDAGFTGGGIDSPSAIAIDGSGNVWTTNYARNSASKLCGADPAACPATAPNPGDPISPSTGFNQGGIFLPEAIAFDQQGNGWISNLATITELNSQGVPLSPAEGYRPDGLIVPVGIAVDGAGLIWIADCGSECLDVFKPDGSIRELNNSGMQLSPVKGFTSATIQAPLLLAIDGAGNIWVKDSAFFGVTEIVGAAAGIATPLIGPPVSSNER